LSTALSITRMFHIGHNLLFTLTKVHLNPRYSCYIFLIFLAYAAYFSSVTKVRLELKRSTTEHSLKFLHSLTSFLWSKQSINAFKKYFLLNKMQSEWKTSPPVPPPGKLNETCVIIDSAYSRNHIKTKHHPQNVNLITLHCHQRRTELWPQVTCTENLENEHLIFPVNISHHHHSHPRATAQLHTHSLLPQTIQSLARFAGWTT